MTTTGQAVVAFVIIKENYLRQHSPEGLVGSLRTWVGEQIGPIARPRDVYIVGELPKTRSGKICLLYTSPSPRDKRQSRMPSSA